MSAALDARFGPVSAPPAFPAPGGLGFRGGSGFRLSQLGHARRGSQGGVKPVSLLGFRV